MKAVLPVVALLLGGACSLDGPTETDNHNPVAGIVVDPLELPFGDNHQTIVTLDGSGSFDEDGDPLTFLWTGSPARFENGTSASDSIAQVSYAVRGSGPRVVQLTVTAGRGGLRLAAATIEIAP